MSSKRFKWAGHEFTEVVERGERTVVLTLHNPIEDFYARSENFLREEAAARLLADPEVQLRTKIGRHT